MKKIAFIFIGLLSLTFVYSFLNGQDKPTASNFLIIRYNDVVTLFQGKGSAEQIKCKFSSNDCVINLLSQYEAEGYELISTTTAPMSRVNNTLAIVLFLKKKM